MDDDEVVDDVIGGGDDGNEESSDEESVIESGVSASEALDALQVTLRWLEQRNAGPNHLPLVTKWRDEASGIRSQSLKQTSLLSCFHVQNK